MLFGYECDNIILDGDRCKGVYVRKGDENIEIFADHTVIATGRRGADWLESSALSMISPISPARSTSACALR